jgi:predicted PurR-regulated permease PerM
MKGKMNDKTLVFSWWLWVLAIFFRLGFTSYSPFLPLLIALVVATYLVVFKFRREYHWTKKVAIISLELLFTVMSYSPKSIFDTTDLLITVMIAMMYLFYVNSNGTNVYELYFKRFPEAHNGETFMEHLKNLSKK